MHSLRCLLRRNKSQNHRKINANLTKQTTSYIAEGMTSSSLNTFTHRHKCAESSALIGICGWNDGHSHWILHQFRIKPRTLPLGWSWWCDCSLKTNEETTEPDANSVSISDNETVLLSKFSIAEPIYSRKFTNCLFLRLAIRFCHIIVTIKALIFVVPLKKKILKNAYQPNIVYRRSTFGDRCLVHIGLL